jgi:uncharacterized membrane protein (TIGR01666 family)
MRWQKATRYALNFFAGEYFTDALRVSISVILPLVIFLSQGKPQIAIPLAVGSLLISITDVPGTLRDKLTMSVISTGLFAVLPVIAAFTAHLPLVFGLVLFVLAFLFGFLNVFGARYSMLGTAALLLVIFIYGLKPANPLSFSLFVFLGGIWYCLLSIAQARIWYLRSVRHAIGECIQATANFMIAKACFYNPDISLDDCYRKTMSLHAQVSQKQEMVRDILLRDKRIMQQQSSKGGVIRQTASRVIDVYEQINAIHYHYEFLRSALKGTGILEAITEIISLLADDFQATGDSLCANTSIRHDARLISKLSNATEKLAALVLTHQITHPEIPQKLKHNLQEISHAISSIKETLHNKTIDAKYDHLIPLYHQFVPQLRFEYKTIRSHLSFESPLFRFAIRLATACIFTYGLTFLLPFGSYNYWMLLTVVVILKPGFSISKQRNLQRLKGTLAGLVIGLILLTIFPSYAVQIGFSIVFLLGFISLIKINYTVSVVFITTMVMLCLNMYGGRSSYIWERLVDTVAGCGIAYAASYLYPVWETKRVRYHIQGVLKANINYLQKLYDKACNRPFDITEFKLARKEANIKLADLASSFQDMLTEPQVNESQIRDIYQFQLLNHQLVSAVAAFFSSDSSMAKQLTTLTEQKIVNDAIEELKAGLQASKAPLLMSSDRVLQGSSVSTVSYEVEKILTISEEIRTKAQSFS